MDVEVLKRIYTEAQNTARRYAHHQNLGTIGLPRGGLGRIFAWVYRFLFNPYKGEIRSEEMTQIVNALLNAGNALETFVKGMEAAKPQESLK